MLTMVNTLSFWSMKKSTHATVAYESSITKYRMKDCVNKTLKRDVNLLETEPSTRLVWSPWWQKNYSESLKSNVIPFIPCEYYFFVLNCWFLIERNLIIFNILFHWIFLVFQYVRITNICLPKFHRMQKITFRFWI